MNKKELIIETIENLSVREQLYLYNEYLSDTNGFDDTIYSMDEFNEIMSGQDAEWIANRIYYGEYNPTANYFKFDGYGNIQSIFTFQIADYIDIEGLAEYIIENNTALYNDDIQLILDGEDDENEEK